MLWLRTSLTLLAIAASVLVAPILSWGSVAELALPDCLQGIFVRGTVDSMSLSNVLLVPGTDWEGRVLAYEDEAEELRGEPALGEFRVCFLVCWWYRKAPDCRLIALRSVLSPYHLRC